MPPDSISCFLYALFLSHPAPSSTTAAAAAAAVPAQTALNPSQIALAAARNLGVPSALPGQAAGGLAGLGAAAGLQSNPQLLAQVMRAQQQTGNPGQCESTAGDVDAFGVRFAWWYGQQMCRHLGRGHDKLLRRLRRGYATGASQSLCIRGAG